MPVSCETRQFRIQLNLTLTARQAGDVPLPVHGQEIVPVRYAAPAPRTPDRHGGTVLQGSFGPVAASIARTSPTHDQHVSDVAGRVEFHSAPPTNARAPRVLLSACPQWNSMTDGPSSMASAVWGLKVPSGISEKKRKYVSPICRKYQKQGKCPLKNIFFLPNVPFLQSVRQKLHLSCLLPYDILFNYP